MYQNLHADHLKDVVFAPKVANCILKENKLKNS